jgi:hypothetical protein
MVLQGCYSGVTVVVGSRPFCGEEEKSFEGVFGLGNAIVATIFSSACTWCHGDVTVVLQGCYSDVAVLLQWCYSGVTVVIFVPRAGFLHSLPCRRVPCRPGRRSSAHLIMDNADARRLMRNRTQHFGTVN